MDLEGQREGPNSNAMPDSIVVQALPNNPTPLQLECT